MDKSREEIPQWTWYNGNFLFQFEEQLKINPSLSISDFFDQFQKSQGIYGLNFYHTKNQGTIFLLLYGLLVTPKEIWEKSNTDFNFYSRKYFEIKTGDTNISTLDFLRLLRNSLSHANFSINPDRNIILFWNINNSGTKNFEVEINYPDIAYFLNEIGKYYINDVKNHTE